jgi:hypothetical protein
MQGATLEAKNLKLEILPEGQELIREVITLACGKTPEDTDFTGNDLATVVGDALMYYKILLEHKNKGGDVILKYDEQQVKLPVVASVN